MCTPPFVLFLLLTVLSGLLRAQDAPARYVQLTYANDYFTATDYYYTQGIRLEFGHGRRVYGIGQEGYTPTSIRADEVLVGDRPYAGALYLIFGNSRAAARGCGAGEGVQWYSEILAGVVGPASLAAAEQKWIHRQTGNVEPMGWRFQIANDLLLDYRLVATHSLAERRFLAWTVSGTGRLGTYRSRLALGSDLRIGLLDGRYGLALHLRPAARLVLRDATLQGGLFNRGSPYVLEAAGISRAVGQVGGGVELRLGRLTVDFSHTYLSREFRTGRPHAWGTVRLRYGSVRRQEEAEAGGKLQAISR